MAERECRERCEGLPFAHRMARQEPRPENLVSCIFLGSQ